MFCIAYCVISSQDKTVSTASYPNVLWKLSWVYRKRHLLKRFVSLCSLILHYSLKAVTVTAKRYVPGFVPQAAV